MTDPLSAPDLPETYSLAEAAKLLHKTPKTLRNKLSRGENDFGAVKILGRWRVYRRAVDAMVRPPADVLIMVRGVRARLVDIPDVRS